MKTAYVAQLAKASNTQVVGHGFETRRHIQISLKIKYRSDRI